jgi:Rrf2 family transcriptional regulator, nitric oxide-sensitive transcriptional repressor
MHLKSGKSEKQDVRCTFMRLTVFTDYALRVLLVLATRTDSLVTIGDVSAAFDISDAHLTKVAHVLGKTGWVDTVRGRNGGMRLAVAPRTLRLGEIVQRLEADFALVECFGPDNRCVLTGGCGLQQALALAMKAFLAELDRYTLADLVNASPALASLPMPQALTWKPGAARLKARA